MDRIYLTTHNRYMNIRLKHIVKDVFLFTNKKKFRYKTIIKIELWIDKYQTKLYIFMNTNFYQYLLELSNENYIYRYLGNNICNKEVYQTIHQHFMSISTLNYVLQHLPCIISFLSFLDDNSAISNKQMALRYIISK